MAGAYSITDTKKNRLYKAFDQALCFRLLDIGNL